jgi:hypothetical protein
MKYMDNVLIGQKGTYPLYYDLSPLVYCPEADAILITRFFIGRKMSEEDIINNIVVALCHESIHEAICKSIGENESRAFDKVPYFNKAIEEWLGWHYVLKV